MQKIVEGQLVAGEKLNPIITIQENAPPSNARIVSGSPLQPLLATLLDNIPTTPENVIQTGNPSAATACQAGRSRR